VAVECLRRWASSRLLELSVYTPIELGGIRSIRRHDIVTVLTGNSCFDFAFGSRYCLFRGKIAPLIVGSPTDDHAQLTGRNGIRTQGCLSYSISLVGRIE
jgi:hypothetical protein